MKKDSTVVQYTNTGDILQNARRLIESSRRCAYRVVNLVLMRRNWLHGHRIAEEELKGERVEYGLEVIKNLSKELIKEFGKGFDRTNFFSSTSFSLNLLTRMC